MHLRSGRLLGQSILDTASRATTHESKTLSVGKCEACLEHSSSESKFSSMVGSEELGFVPPSDMPRDKGKGPVNPFATDLECKQRLVFLFENPQRALIYRDTNGRFLAKTQEQPTIFQREPWVSFQGDICIGEDGA